LWVARVYTFELHACFKSNGWTRFECTRRDGRCSSLGQVMIPNKIARISVIVYQCRNRKSASYRIQWRKCLLLTTRRCERRVVFLCPSDRMNIRTWGIGPVIIDAIPSIKVNQEARADHIGNCSHTKCMRRMASVDCF
jgi:hypothetical protein